MNTQNNLYDQLKRLIEFSGGTVKGVSLTADGSIGEVNFQGQNFKLFVVPTTKPLQLAK